jgi:hypothetical protein
LASKRTSDEIALIKGLMQDFGMTEEEARQEIILAGG